MCTVSPRIKSSYPDGPAAEKEDEEKRCNNLRRGRQTNQISPDEEVDDAEEVEEGKKAHLQTNMKSSFAPSRQEMLEHNITHFPAAQLLRAICKGSVQVEQTLEHRCCGNKKKTVPIVGGGYLFRSNR